MTVPFTFSIMFQVNVKKFSHKMKMKNLEIGDLPADVSFQPGPELDFFINSEKEFFNILYFLQLKKKGCARYVK